MKTQTKLTLSATVKFSITEKIELYQVVNYYSADDSYDLSNGEYIHSCRDGRYYNKDGERYEMLNLGVYDAEDGDIQESHFLGFVKMNEL